MNELATYQERGISARPSTLMDKETFQQIAEIASIMASASLIPESLAYEGSGDKKKPLAPETVRANCFLVANQAVNWGMDPFAVAQCSSVVHGRLMFEGKLVSSVIEAKLGIKLVHTYGKWDPAKEACILGEDGTGDALAIRIGEGRYNEDGVAVFTGRFVDGHVGGWKTTGANTPWRVGRNRVMLVYRGTREFARIYEPGVMLGVITEDEYDPAYNARDITPAAPTAGAGQSVIDRLKANQSKNADGFDPDRVNKDLNSAAPPRSGEEVAGDGTSANEVEAAPTASTSVDSGPAPEAGKGGEGADVAVGESSAPSEPDGKQWLLDVAGMLWAATNFNGDQELLKSQKKIAMDCYDPSGIPKQFRDKANSAFNHCMSVVAGEVEPSDGLAIVAGIVGVEEKVLVERSGRKA
ncbi:hypothetical protein ASE36_00390 [Rhizobium sp. Root274]|uniref:hypothetical protein n=1 Tax=unclassified Rhizobium TaxID=2613769 RepID=UPI00071544D4|nr:MULTISPECIES: hypothetical protein [unclassified Rhizobium]KQW30797.1 hypothetical protein ASC71_00390 [Rhizobium sp. Root1240]KRD32344.1 hypothetical protein ASE36_00390 [Rhizobium sp. Root274]